jgi:hypothetical protein
MVTSWIDWFCLLAGIVENLDRLARYPWSQWHSFKGSTPFV